MYAMNLQDNVYFSLEPRGRMWSRCLAFVWVVLRGSADIGREKKMKIQNIQLYINTQNQNWLLSDKDSLLVKHKL